MKGFFKNNSDKIWANVIVGVILIAFYFLISKISELMGVLSFFGSVLSPFVIGFAIAYVLLPFVEKCEKLIKLAHEKTINTKAVQNINKKLNQSKSQDKKSSKLSRGLAVFLVYILVLIVLAFLINQLIPQIIESAISFVNNIPNYITQLKIFLDYVLIQYNLNEFIAEQSKLYDTFFEYGTNFAQGFLDWLLGVPKILSSGITNMIIGIILSIYFVFDVERFKNGAKKIVRVMFGKVSKTVFYISKETDKYFSKFFMGKIIDSLIIGLIAFPFMLIIYRPYALLISAVIGITNIIPYFGPIVGAVPGGILLLINAPEKIIWYIIFVLVLQQFDGNILGPKILGDRTGLSPVGVIFGIFVGGKLFGFIGMVIGVPITAVIYSVAKGFINKKYQEKTSQEVQEET